MSKENVAVIKIDSCNYCPAMDGWGNKCRITGKEIPIKNNTVFVPSWCPFLKKDEKANYKEVY